MSENPILWQPSPERREKSAMFRFMTERSCADYAELYRWSLDKPAEFWECLVGFCEVRFSREPKVTLEQPGDMTSARWFVGSELNFAEHLLRRDDDEPAIIFRGEQGQRREVSFGELRTQVASIAAGLTAAGVTDSSSAAFTKLRWRAEASNARNAFSG